MNEMDEYDREWLREYLEMTDAETIDILNRTLKVLDEEYNTMFLAQDIANTIEAFERAKADAWSDSP